MKQDVSRQMEWQRRNKAAGKCTSCGKPHNADSCLCSKCRAKHYRQAVKASKLGRPRVEEIEAREFMWGKVDWTYPNRAIAAMLGMTDQAVWKERKNRFPGVKWEKRVRQIES